MAAQLRWKSRLWKSRRAVTALEYALIAAALAILIAGSAFALGRTTNQVFDHIWDLLRQQHSYRGG